MKNLIKRLSIGIISVLIFLLFWRYSDYVARNSDLSPGGRMIVEYPFHEIVIPLVNFVILYIILYNLFFLIFPKFKNISLKYKIALLSGVSHFILTTYLCIRVATLIKSEPEIGMMFFYCRFYDLPFFFIPMLLDNLFRDMIGYNLSNVIFPFISFSVMGSLAYASLGLIVGKIIEKIKLLRKSKNEGRS